MNAAGANEKSSTSGSASSAESLKTQGAAEPQKTQSSAESLKTQGAAEPQKTQSSAESQKTQSNPSITLNEPTQSVKSENTQTTPPLEKTPAAPTPATPSAFANVDANPDAPVAGATAPVVNVVHAQQAQISRFGLIKLFAKKDVITVIRYPLMLIIECLMIAIVVYTLHYTIIALQKKAEERAKLKQSQNKILTYVNSKFTLQSTETDNDTYSRVSKTQNSFIYHAVLPDSADVKYGENYFVRDHAANESIAAYSKAYTASLEYLSHPETPYSMDCYIVVLKEVELPVGVFHVVIHFFVIYFIISIFSISLVMQEKESSIHAYMIIMGLRRYCFYGCHFVFSTLKIWIVGLVLSYFVVHLQDTGLALFFSCFLYCHYIVYFGILVTTVVNRMSYALFLNIISTAAQFALLLFPPFNIYRGVLACAFAFVHPSFALYIIGFNLQLIDKYDQPMYIFSNTSFYAPLGPAFIALLWHNVVIVLLTFYLDYVFPVDNTQKLHPLFFIGVNKRVFTHPDLDSATKTKGGHHEPVPESAKPGIVVNNVCKRWSNTEIAVNHASFVALKNQVTGLLGHNGAGKSTLFGCLTGLYRPTSGQILVDANETVGYCPQWDPIFSRLTVREHLHFYGTLKTGYKVTGDQVEDVIKAVGLTGSESVYASRLSGGQKRKLSVGMAIIGDSKIVLLDEPTAGMDPVARHSMIGIIEGIQQGRTVLLTTHYMDEAESVADRVIILSKGEVTCSGSIDFLKSKYSTGFLLTVVFAEVKLTGSQANDLALQMVALIKNECEQATIYGSVGMQFSIRFPQSAQRSLPKIFSILEEKKKEFMVDTFGINVNSLEEVFLKVGETTDPESDKDTHNAVADVMANICEGKFANSQPIAQNTLFLERSELSNFPFQIMALFVRRFHYSRRHYLFTLIPYVLVILLLFLRQNSLTKEYFNPSGIRSPVIDAIKTGPDMTILIQNSSQVKNTKLFDGIKAYLSYPNVHFREFNSYDFNATDLLYEAMKTYPPLAFMFVLYDNNDVLLSYSNSFQLAPLVLLEAYTNSVEGKKSDVNFSITAEYIRILEMHSDIGVEKKEKSVKDVYLNFINLLVVFIITGPVMLYTCEAQGTQHLYRLAKLTTPMYWIISFIVEMVFNLPILIILIVIVLKNPDIYAKDDYVVALPANLLYLMACIFEVFCFSKIFNNGKLAMTVIFLFNIMGFMIIRILELRDVQDAFTKKTNALSEYSMYFFPPAILMPEIKQNSEKKYGMKRNFFDDYMGIIPTTTTAFPPLFDLSLSQSNFNNRLVSVAIYFGLLMAITIIQDNAGRMMQPIGEMMTKTSDLQKNPDVEKEEEKVTNASGTNAVTAFHLMKIYLGLGKLKIAVQDLTIGISPGECFGLLGANGAGKSTTFSMLTASTIPSSGTAFVNGHRVSNFCSLAEFGFCPQGNAVLEELSVDETFYLFCRLAGRVKIKYCVNAVVDVLKLKHVRHSKIYSCSGGEKRRISVGVALLTNPNIIMLDEPTAGIDPQTRRRVWDLLIAFRNHGSSEVLSSHSMEECETLCTRIGFLSKGVLQAIGSSQHLRHVFSDKYVLKIILSDATTTKEISNAVLDSFPGTELTAISNATLIFNMPKKVDGSEKPISKIYAELIAFVDEQNEKKDGVIKDFVFADSSLEQVFIATTNNAQL